MKDRICKVRKHNGLTQEKFGDRLGLTRNFIWMVERGDRVPSDRTITDICREFGVREEWLRHGTGEMLVQRSLDQEIAAFLGDATSDKVDFKYRLISVLARMKPEQWELLEQIACDLADEIKKADP